MDRQVSSKTPTVSPKFDCQTGEIQVTAYSSQSPQALFASVRWKRPPPSKLDLACRSIPLALHIQVQGDDSVVENGRLE